MERRGYPRHQGKPVHMACVYVYIVTYPSTTYAVWWEQLFTIQLLYNATSLHSWTNKQNAHWFFKLHENEWTEWYEWWCSFFVCFVLFHFPAKSRNGEDKWQSWHHTYTHTYTHTHIHTQTHTLQTDTFTHTSWYVMTTNFKPQHQWDRDQVTQWPKTAFN